MYKLFILICFVAGTQAQRYFWGKCPDVTVQENFDVSQYMGRWYEMQRYFAIFEVFSDCVTADYTLDGNRVIVNNTGKYPALGYYTVVGDAIQEDPAFPAKLGVSFDQSPSASRGDYWVIATDYVSYTIVWSCTQGSFYNSQFAWVLTRDREGLSDETMAQVNNILDANGIRQRPFTRTDQSSCGNNGFDLF